MDLNLVTPRTTRHFIQTMNAKGFDPHKVIDTLHFPTEVYPSKSHPGQWRVTGNGMCIVGRPEGNEFVLITIYADRIVTPMREDQKNDPRALSSKRLNG